MTTLCHVHRDNLHPVTPFHLLSTSQHIHVFFGSVFIGSDPVYKVPREIEGPPGRSPCRRWEGDWE